MHLAIEFFDRLGCETIVVGTEVVYQRVGVGIDVPQQLGKHVFAELHPRGHVVGSCTLLKHQAYTVVVEIL